MTIPAHKYVHLSNLAAAAALDPEKWQDFLDAMTGAIGTRVCAQLIGYDQQTHVAPLAYSSGYDPEILKLYEAHFLDKNPFAQNFAKCGIGDKIASHEMCEPEILKKTEFYAEILRPLEDLYAGGGSMLAFEADRMFLIGGNLRAKDREKHEDDWLQLCVTLAPIIRQSLEVNRMIMGLSFEKWAAERHLLGPGTAIFVVDCNQTIHYACPQAQRLLAAGTVVESWRGHRLQFRSEQAQCQMAMGIRHQANGNPCIFKTVRLHDDAGQEWICRSMGVRIDELDRSPFSAFLSASGLGSASLLALKPVTDVMSVQENLQKAFGLSQVEAKSVLMLAEGYRLADIAAERNVSIYTVRNQIKSAMSKSACHRQSELVQKVEHLRLTGNL